jgi:hypothetical protein
VADALESVTVLSRDKSPSFSAFSAASTGVVYTSVMIVKEPN